LQRFANLYQEDGGFLAKPKSDSLLTVDHAECSAKIQVKAIIPAVPQYIAGEAVY
jgi:hypothetical protein